MNDLSHFIFVSTQIIFTSAPLIIVPLLLFVALLWIDRNVRKHSGKELRTAIKGGALVTAVLVANGFGIYTAITTYANYTASLVVIGILLSGSIVLCHNIIKKFGWSSPITSLLVALVAATQTFILANLVKPDAIIRSDGTPYTYYHFANGPILIIATSVVVFCVLLLLYYFSAPIKIKNQQKRRNILLVIIILASLLPTCYALNARLSQETITLVITH